MSKLDDVVDDDDSAIFNFIPDELEKVLAALLESIDEHKVVGFLEVRDDISSISEIGFYDVTYFCFLEIVLSLLVCELRKLYTSDISSCLL